MDRPLGMGVPHSDLRLPQSGLCSVNSLVSVPVFIEPLSGKLSSVLGPTRGTLVLPW